MSTATERCDLVPGGFLFPFKMDGEERNNHGCQSKWVFSLSKVEVLSVTLPTVCRVKELEN